jgi:predicted transcriptional regulator of viral defense system
MIFNLWMSGGAHQTQPQRLREVASAQSGYFSLTQAKAAGFSSPLIHHHCKTGKFERVRRGIYRFADYPSGDRDDLVILWLWSEQLGVFSHSTALSLHDLSDLMPERVHMTLPVSQRGRQRELPPGLLIHLADLPEQDRTWYASVPVTSPRRTLLDCVAYGLSPDLLRQALAQAVSQGMLDVASITEIAKGIDTLERG